MAANLQFSQRVMTPKGEAVFLGYVGDGFECQVSRRVPATEYDREKLIRMRPALAMDSAEEFKHYQQTARFVVNEIYPEDQVTPIQAKTRQEVAP